MEIKTFAIMGATGTVGRIICEELLKRGHKVRAIGRNHTKLNSLAAACAQTIATSFDSTAELTKAFAGTSAVFCMLPPAYSESSLISFHVSVGDAIILALKNARVKNVVFLSSMGAHHQSGLGPISSLGRFEQRLNKVHELNVVHLRAGYFMENIQWFVDGIKKRSCIITSMKKDLSLPWVAAEDVAIKAVELLERFKVKGISTVEFGGPEELGLDQIVKILGTILGRQISYMEITPEDEARVAMGMGMRPESGELFLELRKALNAKKFKPQSLANENRGNIHFQDFAKDFVDKLESASPKS